MSADRVGPSATTAPLTKEQWQAISLLRAATRAGLDRNILSLRDKIERAVCTVTVLLDETREGAR